MPLSPVAARAAARAGRRLTRGAWHRAFASGEFRSADLEGSLAWVVGGVGIIGRGICRGLLRAGATVIVNSRFKDRLEEARDMFGDVENFIPIHASLIQPEDAAQLVEEVLALPELHGRQLQHVVAHNSVRWWAKEQGDESHFLDDSKAMPLMRMGPLAFAYHACRLPALHHAAATALLPVLSRTAGATYIFVNGGSGKNRTPMDQVNTHAVWGLAEAMREELKCSTVRVEELRVSLEHNRLTRERELDPRPTPLSHDIGDICAGMAANAKGWDRHPDYHAMDNLSDILMLKARYPMEPVYDIG